MKGILTDMGDFIGRHWGDFIGLALLYTGVFLVFYAAVYLGGNQSVDHLGESLVLAAMGILKLRNNPKNGNGNGNGEHPAPPAPNKGGIIDALER